MAKLLVIDDDDMVSRLLKEHLTNEGHEVTTVSNAEEGYQEAKKSSPDLILMDVMLPDETGFQACGKLRQESATRNIPIILMSGTARSRSQQSLGQLMGANEYLLKPLKVIEVGDKVHALLSNPPPTTESVIRFPDQPPAPPPFEDFHLDRLFSMMLAAMEDPAANDEKPSL